MIIDAVLDLRVVNCRHKSSQIIDVLISVDSSHQTSPGDLHEDTKEPPRRCGSIETNCMLKAAKEACCSFTGKAGVSGPEAFLVDHNISYPGFRLFWFSNLQHSPALQEGTHDPRDYLRSAVSSTACLSVSGSGIRPKMSRFPAVSEQSPDATFHRI